MLTGIHVYNYRVLKDVRLGVLRDDLKTIGEKAWYPLEDIAVFVGENRSGKSSLIEALVFLRQTITQGLKSKERRRKTLTEYRTFGVSEAPAFELSFTAPGLRALLFYRLELADAGGEAVIKAESLEKVPLTPEMIEALDRIELRPSEEGEAAEFSFRRTSEGRLFTKNGLSETLYPPDLSVLSDDALNRALPEVSFVRNFFEEMCFLHMPAKEEDAGSIVCKYSDAFGTDSPARTAFLRQVLEKLSSEEADSYQYLSKNLKKALNLGREGDILRWLKRLTDAEKKLAVILLFLFSPEPCSLLVVENPDYGLFPDKVDILARELRNYVLKNPNVQVFMTTSHMNLLESAAPQEVWTFRSERERDDAALRGPEDVPDIHVKAAASDPLICAMYAEGVGLGTLLYGGYLA